MITPDVLQIGDAQKVAESDLVAVVSELSIELFERRKTLCRLPLRLETPGTVSMYWRKDAVGSAAVEGLLQTLRAVTRRR